MIFPQQTEILVYLGEGGDILTGELTPQVCWVLMSPMDLSIIPRFYSCDYICVTKFLWQLKFNNLPPFTDASVLGRLIA